MTQPPSLLADLLDLLDEDLRYQFEERAGIMEFDGSLSRDYSECLAMIDLLRSHPGALLGVSLLKFEHGGDMRYVICCDQDTVEHLCKTRQASIVDPAAFMDAISTKFHGAAVLTAMT